ncbi:PREDICTED: uncharacterized protein LOC109132659 [Camelina sativa]|uniref:Uncharacterized protein LOC109132659 n=1 Tax=Camelina sativa TaxID=90675 RepID=A0ABM1RM73_CAMSA|nr:PREDICTED: uncharacterized protein LOC109132659 [Camelina sativa]
MFDRNGLGPHIHLSGPKSYRKRSWEERSVWVKFFSKHIQSRMVLMLMARQRKSIKLISGSCKRRWLSSRQIQLFQMVLHTVGSSPAMNVLPSFLSALRRIHVELLMVLEASNILLAREGQSINRSLSYIARTTEGSPTPD